MIGIFGGTFDPIHYGHLRSALEVSEIFGLDEVRLIPSAQPPHRDLPVASAVMRLHMLELAIINQPQFVIDQRELNRQGKSYMVDTLSSLRDELSQQPLLLFIGSDAFNKLTSWHQWQRLFDYAHIAVLTRPGYVINELDPFFTQRQTGDRRQLSRQISGLLFFQPITQLDISATNIRQIVAAGRNPRFLLPDAVISYINEQQLYQNT
ncbi:MAG: nicotinate-nucleotide adenylyltransferase [Gammaproteobacteria bacterium]|nr:nicotinate-nucleotide adenylyltransferase [Gammaproteobacteria bacterium]